MGVPHITRSAYQSNWRPITPAKARSDKRSEVLQGVGDKLTIMTGMMTLLLTDTRPGCILENSDKNRGLPTNVDSSCVIAIVHQDKS